MKDRNSEIDISCRFCEHSEKMFDEKVVLCEKFGVVEASSSCKRFIYDALKHVPPKNAEGPTLEYIEID